MRKFAIGKQHAAEWMLMNVNCMGFIKIFGHDKRLGVALQPSISKINEKQ